MHLSPKKTAWLAYFILKYYALVTNSYSFHFKTYADKIYFPLIRQEIRALTEVKEENYYTVYLPAYNDQRIIEVLSKLDADLKVFFKHCSGSRKEGSIALFPINSTRYLKSLSACKGVICGAGFEGPSEAVFLKKKLLVIPMRGQYEQQCNAAALRKIGVVVLNSLHKKHLEIINAFISQKETVLLDFPDETEEVISKLITASV